MSRYLGLAVLAVLGSTGAASAGDPPGRRTLTIVPASEQMDSGHSVPFWAETGKKTTVRFVARDGRPPFTVSWRIANKNVQDKNVQGAAETHSDRRLLAVQPEFRIEGDRSRDLITLAVTVRDADGRTGDAMREVVVVRKADLQIARIIAIQNALGYIHSYLAVKDDRATHLPDTDSYPLTGRALALQSLVLCGHNPFDDASTDPFAEDARILLDEVCAKLTAFQADYTGPFDTPHLGIRNGRLLQAGSSYSVYETSIVLMALASVRHPKEAVRVLGEEGALSQICQDLAEFLLAAQQDGGWRYTPRFGSNGPPSERVDFSVSQWPAIALEAFESSTLGEIPPSVELAKALLAAKGAMEPLLTRFVGPDGIVPYGIGPNNERTNPNPGLAGAAMCLAAWVGWRYEDDRVARVRRGLLDRWNVAGHEQIETYAMYSIMKGQRLFEDHHSNLVEVDVLRDPDNQRSRKWYAEFTASLASRQQPDGSWTYKPGQATVDGYTAAKVWRSPGLELIQTCLGTLCLQPRIFEPAPTPLVRAIPATGSSGHVLFDHSESLSGDRQRHIESYVYDFDGTGTHVWKGTKADRWSRPEFHYPGPGTYHGTLTVGYRRGTRNISSTTPFEVAISDQSGSLGFLIPPRKDRIGPVVQGASDQVVFVPLNSELYDRTKSWERYRIAWTLDEDGKVPDPSTVSPKCRFIAVPLGPTTALHSCEVGVVPAGKAETVVSRVGRIDFPGGIGLPRTFATRPLVILDGIPDSHGTIRAALCLLFEDGSAYAERVDLRLLDDNRFGLAARALPARSTGILGVHLQLYSSRLANDKDARAPRESVQGFRIEVVPMERDKQDNFQTNTKRALNELRIEADLPVVE